MKPKVNTDKTNTGNIMKSVLQQELKKFESRVDTKFDAFEKKIDTKFDAFGTKMDFKLRDLEMRVDEKARKYRDQILTSNDKLMRELEEHRQEREIGDFQTKEKLDNHEKRIKILELT